MDQDRTKRKLIAILSADVVGYSRLMEEDQGWTIKTLEDNKKLISEFIFKYQGRVVDAPGDNILAEFSSATNAVECAVKIQEELKRRNANLIEKRRMEFRIGVNLGEVVEENGNIYGSGVNIAARIEGLTEVGGVCISRGTYDHVKTQLDLTYEYLGEHCVKNISEPIRVYRILMDKKPAGKVIGEKRSFSRISRRVEGSLKNIAVLPFVNRSSEEDQEAFVDGLSDEIITRLSYIPGLQVTSSTSSFAFKNTNKTIKEIAEILGREYILEGSVRKAGKAIRITAQLINVADDRHLWAETYNRELEDIFKIQEDIANNIADRLKLTLEAFESLGGTKNIEAYELYLNAKGKRAEGNVSGYNRALELIDKAIALDPEFALAYTYKAHNHILLSMFGPFSHTMNEAKAGLKAAQKAIELEPNLGDGYIYLSNIEATKNNWLEAKLNIDKALKLMGESSSSNEYFLLSFYFSVADFKRAHELLEKMHRNDPANHIITGFYYYIYGFLGDRKKAEERYQHRYNLLSKGYSDLHNDSITTMRLGSGDVLSHDEIVSTFPIHRKGKKHLNSPEEGLTVMRQTYHHDDNLCSVDLSYISIWAAYFADPDFSMKVFEKASVTNGTQVGHCWFPVMKEVRQLPRFKKLMRDIGVVDYWKEYGWPDLCRPVGEDDFECD